MRDNAPNLLQFIGHFHPVLVHLPIGIILVLGLLEAASLVPRWRNAAASSRAILWIAAPAALGTAVCGWLLAAGGGYDPELVARHRWCGVAVAACTPFLLVLDYRKRRAAYRAGLLGLIAIVALAGHFGGELTHGRGFLLRDAPASIRWLLGASATTSGSPARGAASDPLAVPVYGTYIQPFFANYCGACHGPEKAKAGLRLHTLEALQRGGDSGPALVSGRSSESALIKRLQLPPKHEDHMPPEGKNQPTPEEVALLAWWIDTGASPDRTATQLQAPAPIREFLVHHASRPSP